MTPSVVCSHPPTSAEEPRSTPPKCFKIKMIPRKGDSLSCRVSTALGQCSPSTEEPAGHLSRDTALHRSAAHLTSGARKTLGIRPLFGHSAGAFLSDLLLPHSVAQASLGFPCAGMTGISHYTQLHLHPHTHTTHTQ